MAANPVGGSTAPKPSAHTSDPKQDTAPKKPGGEDGKAARNAPGETATAVENTFGKVPGGSKQPESAPKNGDAKQPGNAPKAPADNPKAGGDVPKAPADGAAPKTGQAAPKDAAAPAGDAKAGAPDPDAAKQPQTTKPPANQPGTDPKAAPAADAAGTPVKDSQGKDVTTPDGNKVVLDQRKNMVAVDKNGNTVVDPKGNPYAVDKDGKYMQPEPGKYAVYHKDKGVPIAVDAQGNVVTVYGSDGRSGPPWALDKNGKYLQTEYGMPVTYDFNNEGKLAAFDKQKGTYVQDAKHNLYMVLPDGKFARAAEGNFVVYDQNSGKKPAALDPQTGAVLKDATGNVYAVGDGGNFMKTPDGQDLVYDKTNGNNLAAIDPGTGKIARDPNGNPYLITPEAKYVQTEDGKYAAYDKANGSIPVAVDPITGEVARNVKGNPLALDDNGKYLKTPEGNSVVYEKINGKPARIANDKDGNQMVLNDKPAAVGKDGNYLKTQDGYNVVYDAKGNAVAVDQTDKTITDKNGHPLALDQDGKYLKSPGGDTIVYDKDTGLKVAINSKGEVAASGGIPLAIDENGKFIQQGLNKAIYDGRGNIVIVNDSATVDGYPVYKDVKTGELETLGKNGSVYKIDPATNDFAKDANGNYLSAVYDPVNSDQTRPPVIPNDNPDTTLKNLPQGKERGDPMKIKDELFDENNNLSKENLYKAMGTYDPRDVYDALINSSRAGGWDTLTTWIDDRGIRPNEEQSRQVIAALVAWQNANGKYNPMKKGEMPPLILYNDAPSSIELTTGYMTYNGAFVNTTKLASGAGGLAYVAFHELNHSMTSSAFRDIYYKHSDDRGTEKISPQSEIVTEYLATDWSGDKGDSAYETDYREGFKKLDEAVMKMGNGDRNTGLDLLKRAYYAGDLVALKLLKTYFPPDMALNDLVTKTPPPVQGARPPR